MKCSHVNLGPHGVAIVCTRGERPRICACGDRARYACDWKIKGSRATCSRSICERCASSPTEGKHLCGPHANAWAAHPKNPRAPRAPVQPVQISLIDRPGRS